jgi:hypothetical protein
MTPPPNQFDIDQLDWFERALHADAGDSSLHTIVVGMHAALPDSISKGHSMSDSPQRRLAPFCKG